MSTHEFSRETIEALRRGQTPEGHAAVEQLNLMMNLLVESWDAMSAVVKEHHLRLYNISPTLVERIEAAIEPWAAGPRKADDEPSEPDGECFRGGEAAAYEAEEQARIQRELK